MIGFNVKKNSFIVSLFFIVGLLVLAGCTNTGGKKNNVGELDKDAFTGEIKEFTVEAFQFGFDPSVIEVNQGDKVRIIASSRDVPHGLAIPEFGVNLYLDGVTSQTAEFIADKKGKFSFYCSVPCGAGHRGMKGDLIVK